jgi:hypothetical protein
MADGVARPEAAPTRLVGCQVAQGPRDRPRGRVTRAARSLTADATVAVLDEFITRLARRPQHIRMDNGPELTAYALQDWCRFTGVDPSYMEDLPTCPSR